MKMFWLCLLFSLPVLALDVPQGVIISTGSAVKTNFTTAAPFSLPSDKAIRVQCTEDAWVSLYATDVPAVGPGVSVYLPANAFYTTNTITGTRNVAIKPVGTSSTCTVFWVNGPVYAALSVSGGGGGSSTQCTLDGTEEALATSYRATALTGTGYQCDATMASCVDLGPGARNHIGTNAQGDILLGPDDGSSSTTVKIRGITHMNGALVNGPLDQYNGGYGFRSIGGPYLVDDIDGFQVKCKASLPTAECSSLTETSQVPICGTGGALSKYCVCVGDGTTYAWRNLYNLAAGAGTTTTCPTT